MSYRLPLLLLVIWACCSCSTLTPSPPVSNPRQTPKAQSETVTPAAPPAATAESYRKALIAADLAFSRACEDKGAADAFYEHLAPDGVCLLSGDPPIEGRDAAKVRFSATPAETLTWKPRDVDVCAGADLGYTWGTYQSTVATQDKAAVPRAGKYTIVWKRQSDGGWKVVLFITSASTGGVAKS